MRENKSIENVYRKPIILVCIGNYLPGYKAGGILRNIVNTIDHLSDQFDFKIVTRDRDLGDEKAYDGIKLNDWQKVGGTDVCYLSPEATSYRALKQLLKDTPHDVLLLNSFFEPLTIKTLLNRKLNPKEFKPVIVAPFGEFAWASLGQKYPKKYVFMKLARFIGLYKGVSWRVSSEYEKADLVKVMKVKKDPILITGDLPIKGIPLNDESLIKNKDADLRVVFLSRIAREKNLDYALKVLNKVNASVIFDIYGPAENEVYWNECQEIMEKLPVNIKVNYLGNAKPDQVLNVFSNYDLFLFPTGGEAYGNVIAECLTVGTSVLLSTETPWRNLNEDGLGWDINLKDMGSFVAAIENFAKLTSAERAEKREIVKRNIAVRLFDPFILESNVSLFKMQLTNNSRPLEFI